MCVRPESKQENVTAIETRVLSQLFPAPATAPKSKRNSTKIIPTFILLFPILPFTTLSICLFPILLLPREVLQRVKSHFFPTPDFDNLFSNLLLNFIACSDSPCSTCSEFILDWNSMFASRQISAYGDPSKPFLGVRFILLGFDSVKEDKVGLCNLFFHFLHFFIFVWMCSGPVEASRRRGDRCCKLRPGL